MRYEYLQAGWDFRVGSARTIRSVVGQRYLLIHPAWLSHASIEGNDDGLVVGAKIYGTTLKALNTHPTGCSSGTFLMTYVVPNSLTDVTSRFL